jgi:enediyne biosynthesis protein E4
VNPAGGYLSQSSRVLHFGLGDRTRIDRIEIRWPRGIVQTLDHPEINILLQIREPAR